jgi:hypothetical protein
MKITFGPSFLTPPNPFVRFAIQVKIRRGRHARLMNKKDILFAAIALSVIGLFIFLSINRRHPPAMTARPEHAGVTSETPRETCWSCHTYEMLSQKHHPRKGLPPDQTTPCAVCHEMPREQAASLHSIIKSKGVFPWPNQQQR